MKPNILLIMAEDICPNLGCYGDPNARTPHLDAFARTNYRFSQCYSAAPVCSAARTSLNLGMYGTTAGVGQHRSMYDLPSSIRNIGEWMQKAGYYTVIGKTDFNFPLKEGYDQQIDYTYRDTLDFAGDILNVAKNLPEDKPLFMIQTSAITHQSQYGYTNAADEHRASMPRLKEEEYQEREAVKVPGYHFDTADAKEIWAQYHEKLTSFDRMFGELIAGLRDNGLYENSVILFVGDNGHGIPQGKINLWNEGVHVPMLMHVPEELENQVDYKRDPRGKYSDRKVTFVDFAPTFLSVAGAAIPENMQGHAFLGEHKTAAENRVYSFCAREDEVFENSRSIHEGEWMYTIDFAFTSRKRLNAYQILQAPWFVRSMILEGRESRIQNTERRALFRSMPRIREQLYNLREDPNQLYSLIDSECEAHKKIRRKLQKALIEKIIILRDAAFIPEPLLQELTDALGLTAYEVLQDDLAYPVKKLAALWEQGMNGVQIGGIFTNPCEQIIQLTFTKGETGEQKIIEEYLLSGSETVRACAALKGKNMRALYNICYLSQNYVLLMFIVDVITFWDAEEAEPIFSILVSRCLEKQDIQVDARLEAGMVSGLNILAAYKGWKMPAELREQLLSTVSQKERSKVVMSVMEGGI